MLGPELDMICGQSILMGSELAVFAPTANVHLSVLQRASGVVRILYRASARRIRATSRVHAHHLCPDWSLYQVHPTSGARLSSSLAYIRYRVLVMSWSNTRLIFPGRAHLHMAWDDIMNQQVQPRPFPGLYTSFARQVAWKSVGVLLLSH